MALEPAEIYNALKNEQRIQTLRLVDEGGSLTEIADELNMSNSGVHSYLSDLEEVYLIESKNRTRQITEVGKVVLEFTDELAVEVNEAQKEMVSRAIQNTAQNYGFASDLSDEELRDILEKEE